DWVDGDVELRRTGHPRAQLFAFENTWRVVLDSFANDDFAADVHQIEHAAHGVAGCRVGRFLVTASEPSERIQGSGFRRARKIQLDDSLDVLVISFRQSQSHGALIFTQVARDDKSAIRAARWA